jgi:hypothetical protein
MKDAAAPGWTLPRIMEGGGGPTDQDTHLRRGVLPEGPTDRDHTLRCAATETSIFVISLRCD